MEGIKDKVVVITVASSGIGEATAVMLAERGAKVVLGARGLDRVSNRGASSDRFPDTTQSGKQQRRYRGPI